MCVSNLKKCAIGRLLISAALPDFQYASAGDPLMEQIRDNLVSFKCRLFPNLLKCAKSSYVSDSRLNDFQLRPDLNISQVNAGPSPEWSQMRVAFPYAQVLSSILSFFYC